MRDFADYQEIENLGETEQDVPETEQQGKGETGGSFLPLFQAALCALALAALVFLKMSYRETYDRVQDWYGREMAREIQLPWQNAAPADSASSAGELPGGESAPNSALQRV